jgi:riboflavin synthase
LFTGIVEEVGRVASLEYHNAGAKFSIQCARVLSDLTLGASIAVNGVCLTAIDIRPDGFSADLAPETLDRTNLGDLRRDDRTNLERPLKLETRLSGHIVQGHVDSTGTIESLTELGDGNWELDVRAPRDLDRFLVYKGSVAIDGISLTIASVQSAEGKDPLLRVAIIPHTYEATNLAGRRAGERVNIECDVLAKHVDKLLSRIALPR